MTVLGREQHHEAAGADAAHPDDLDRGVFEAIPVEQHPPIVGQRGAVGVEELRATISSVSSGGWKINGGWSTMRMRPPSA